MVFQPDIRPGTELTSTDLKSIFKGQEEGGMRYSKATRSLLLVTDHKKLSATSIYADEWVDGVLHYRGTGQRGDQNIDFAGNSRLVHAATDDTGVHLVERSGKGRYRYLGRVDLAGDPYRRNEVDADGKMRLVWVFPLRLLDPAAEAAVAEASVPEAVEIPTPLTLVSDEAVRIEVVSPHEPGLAHESIQLLLLEMERVSVSMSGWLRTTVARPLMGRLFRPCRACATPSRHSLTRE